MVWGHAAASPTDARQKDADAGVSLRSRNGGASREKRVPSIATDGGVAAEIN